MTSIGTDYVFTSPLLGEVYVVDGIEICMLDPSTVVLFDGDAEVARYQQGTLHEAVTLFTFDTPAAKKIIEDNHLPVPDFEAEHEWPCDEEKCHGHFHVSVGYENWPPQAMFVKRLRGARQRHGSFGGNTPWDWSSPIAPKSDFWFIAQGFGFPEED